MYAVYNTEFNNSLNGPALSGPCGYRIDGDRIIINIGTIANTRDFGDLSGTLSVELWALKQPYEGTDFQGAALAGTQVGEVGGQYFVADCQYDLIFNEPPAGTWYLSLMLREWTDGGYVTRDFVNFAAPYVSEGKLSLVRNANVINFPGNDAVAEKPAEVVAEPAANTAKSEAKVKPAAKAEVSAPAANKVSNAPAKGKASAKSDAISLNEAKTDEIASVKGISKKLAEKIVETRPFSSVDDVLKVKGMGAKLLHKVRQYLTL